VRQIELKRQKKSRRKKGGGLQIPVWFSSGNLNRNKP